MKLETPNAAENQSEQIKGNLQRMLDSGISFEEIRGMLTEMESNSGRQSEQKKNLEPKQEQIEVGAPKQEENPVAPAESPEEKAAKADELKAKIENTFKSPEEQENDLSKKTFGHLRELRAALNAFYEDQDSWDFAANNGLHIPGKTSMENTIQKPLVEILGGDWSHYQENGQEHDVNKRVANWKKAEDAMRTLSENLQLEIQKAVKKEVPRSNTAEYYNPRTGDSTTVR